MELPTTNILEILLFITLVVLGFLARTTYERLNESIQKLTTSINVLNSELNQSIKEQAQINSEVLSRVTRLEALSNRD